MQKKCLFFDRDGIVNESPGPGYVEHWKDFKLIPAFLTCAKTALTMGYTLAIATNQRGIATGIMTQSAVDEIHNHLITILEKNNIPLLGIYCCPHQRDSCDCRKPKPGLLLQAAREHNIDLSASWMIGDSETDIQAGQQAGCHTIRICHPEQHTTADYHLDNMDELATKLQQILTNKK